MTTTPHAELLTDADLDALDEFSLHWAAPRQRDSVRAYGRAIERALLARLGEQPVGELAAGWIAGRAETYADVYPCATPAEAYRAGAEFALRSRTLHAVAHPPAAQPVAQGETMSGDAVMRLFHKHTRSGGRGGFKTDWDAMAAELVASTFPEAELGGCHLNESAWKFIEAMPHHLPGPIFNDLKPALKAAVDEYLKRAGLLASRSSAQGAAQVPPGWKLVPEEPTDAMVDATHHGQPVSDIYRDMLAAAPSPAGERTSTEGDAHA